MGSSGFEGRFSPVNFKINWEEPLVTNRGFEKVTAPLHSSSSTQENLEDSPPYLERSPHYLRKSGDFVGCLRLGLSEFLQHVGN